MEEPLSKKHPALLLCKGASCSIPVTNPEQVETALSIIGL